MKYQEVIEFWFHELQEKQWFVKDASVDEMIKKRFMAHYEAAACGECFSWRKAPEGRLAEIICLDQFPRNMFRNSAQAFATDPLALVLAQEAVSLGVDNKLGRRRSFLYMPYMHSESRIIQEESLRLFNHPQISDNLQFAKGHHAIILKFGRYPHRNAVLNRATTQEEARFLEGPNSRF